jgi:hypothetical protein
LKISSEIFFGIRKFLFMRARIDLNDFMHAKFSYLELCGCNRRERGGEWMDVEERICGGESGEVVENRGLGAKI